MKSDVSRLTFLPDLQFNARQYSRVLIQQGRPSIDADFNEQTASLLHAIRQTAADVIGQHGGASNKAFEIGVTIDPGKNPNPAFIAELTIDLGRYYVGGFLCENLGRKKDPAPAAQSAASAAVTADVFEPFTFLDQPYYPPPVGGWKPGVFHLPALVYLDVWEHHRTWIDDGGIVDQALSGADPSTRVRVVWQVKLLPLSNLTKKEIGEIKTQSGTAEPDWVKKLKNRGRLRAGLEASRPSAHCGAQPGEKYQGIENQLYRVEVHNPGPLWDGADGTRESSASFKWSRENGSVVARWVQDPKAGGDSLTIQGPRDPKRGFKVGDWVELTDEGRELRGEPGRWVKLTKVEGRRLSFTYEGQKEGKNPIKPEDFPLNPKVRRWDQVQREDLEFRDGAILGVKPPSGAKGASSDPAWVPIENGIRVQSLSTDAKTEFQSGDYWLISARAESGTIEGPTDERGAPPFGIDHHYAPLLLVQEKAPKETPLRFVIKKTLAELA